MQTNVSNMEAEMKRLQENMEKITTCTAQINNTLDPRRQRVRHRFLPANHPAHLSLPDANKRSVYAFRGRRRSSARRGGGPDGRYPTVNCGRPPPRAFTEYL